MLWAEVDILWQPAHDSSGCGEMDGQSHGPAQRGGEHLKTQVSTMEQTVPRVSCRLVNDES